MIPLGAGAAVVFPCHLAAGTVASARPVQAWDSERAPCDAAALALCYFI